METGCLESPKRTSFLAYSLHSGTEESELRLPGDMTGQEKFFCFFSFDWPGVPYEA